MRKIILSYGEIKKEYSRPKDYFYRKGSYYVLFNSDKLDLSCSVGGPDKYSCYKGILEEIYWCINNKDVIYD